jgi:hypothetical protein
MSAGRAVSLRAKTTAARSRGVRASSLFSIARSLAMSTPSRRSPATWCSTQYRQPFAFDTANDTWSFSALVRAL